MENNNKKNVFETLNAINVSGKTEKKNGLTYLSWAYAWAEVKKLYPDAQYKVYERDTQRPVTAQMVDIIKKTIEEHGVSKEFICKSYKIGKLEDLKVYQAKHIGKNLDKLKKLFDNEKKEHLADIVKNTKPKEMPTSFNEAICSSQQGKEDSEPIDLESLGLSPADLDALTECGNVFN